MTDIESMEQIVSISTSRRRVNMLLMSVFSGSALLLAAIGIYGLMAYTVEQRTREIGIRIAMGAEAGILRKMVIKQGMGLVIVGVVVGLGAAYLLANVLASFLFEVEPRDIVVFTSVPILLLLLIALVAVWIPATRASRVDALGALRTE